MQLKIARPNQTCTNARMSLLYRHHAGTFWFGAVMRDYAHDSSEENYISCKQEMAKANYLKRKHDAIG